MKKQNLLMTAAIAGLIIGAPMEAQAGKKGYEKCKGVAPKGANSCGANGHGCGGFAKKDYNGEEWIYVKKGQCSKIKKAMKDPALKEFLNTATKNARKYSDNFES